MHLTDKINKSLFNSFTFVDSVIMSLIKTNSVYNIIYIIIKFVIATVFIINSRLLNLKFRTNHRGSYQSLMNAEHLHYCLS